MQVPVFCNLHDMVNTSFGGRRLFTSLTSYVTPSRVQVVCCALSSQAGEVAVGGTAGGCVAVGVDKTACTVSAADVETALESGAALPGRVQAEKSRHALNTME